MEKSTRRSRRHRNTHSNEGKEQQPFFSKSNDTPVQKKENPAFFQPKLTVGQPNDKYEKEADSVADSVVNKSAEKPTIQKQDISSIQRTTLASPVEDEKLGTAEGRMEKDKLIQEKPEIQRMDNAEEEQPVQKMEEEEPVQKMEEEESVQKMEEEEPVQKMEEEEEPVQAKSNGGQSKASSGLSNQIKNKSGKGQGIANNTRSEMESSFGRDFSNVNIHTDNESVEMNKKLNAQAFTHGNDIYFNSGKYRPETAEGKRLLAHELTHVVQQDKNQQKIQREDDKRTASNPNNSLSIHQQRIKLNTPPADLPAFATMRNAFPAGDLDEVKKKIGGKVSYDWIKNTCAIRISRVLNYSGFPIPFEKDQTISGADKMWYYYRISKLRPFIESTFGKPDLTFTKPYDMTELSKYKGIMLFDVDIWRDATGHYTLWDGRECADKCHFSKSKAVYLWLSK